MTTPQTTALIDRLLGALRRDDLFFSPETQTELASARAAVEAAIDNGMTDFAAELEKLGVPAPWQIIGYDVYDCSQGGHKWEFAGGMNCGCEDGSCLISVNRCIYCGDYDDGENEEADEIRKECKARS
jgi:hypothetical protein